MESTTHQIFVTSKLRTKYPDYFTNSSNQKYVSILAVYLFKDDVQSILGGESASDGILGGGMTDYEDPAAQIRALVPSDRNESGDNEMTQQQPASEPTFSILQYCQLHADFVQDDECLEQYVCMANLPLYHKRKYKQYNNPRYFNVWFTDYKGTKIELDSSYHFVVELLLEY